MSYALLGFLVILVIAQAVIVWKTVPVWRWYDLVAIMVTMILAVVFVFPVAGVLKSRSAWHKVKADLEAQIKQVQAEQNELKYGDPNNPVAEDGVLPLAQKLAKLAAEAGRRWRGLQMANSNFNGVPSIVLRNPNQDDQGADPDAGAAAADGDEDAADLNPLPLIPQDMVVYGFGEAQAPGVEVLVPRAYLGEFRVTASTPTEVTLTPTVPLLPDQQQLIQNGVARSWSLYELLPLDSHEPFIAEGSKPDDDNVFGRVNDELINALFQNISEERRSRYLRDGSRLNEQDPVLSHWVKIEFIKKHSIVVDSPDQRGALDGGFFDGSGRAVDSRLQRGADGKATFEKGTLLIVKKEAADTLLDEGVARLVDNYYLRPLNDYRFVLRNIRLRLTELGIRTEELKFENEVLQNAVDATVRMKTVYQDEKLKLEQDFLQTETERKALESYNTNLRETVKEVKQRLVRLYQQNQQLEQELQEIHSRIQTGVNSLTAVR